MPWFRWRKTERSPRTVRNRNRSRAGDPFEPRLFRLEDRRVLDVSAAFSTATGQLQLLLTNTADSAVVTVETGNISIKDSHQNAVTIDVDGGGPGTVNASHVDSLAARGDATPGQTVTLAAPLDLPKGLQVEASIERFELTESIGQIDQGPVQIAASQIRLAADVETTGQDIALLGAVELANAVQLTGRDITFGNTLDDDGVALTPSSLLVHSSGVTRFAGDLGSVRPIEHLETDQAGRTELGADITAIGASILLWDPVLLTADVRLSDQGTSGIVFGSHIDSATGGLFDLTLNASQGNIRFDGDLGAGTNGDQRLGALTIERAASGVEFGGQSEVHEIRVAGAVQLGSAAQISGAGIAFVGGGAGTNLLAGGGLQVHGAVSLGGDLRVRTQDANITFTSASTINSQTNLSSALSLDAGAGAIAFNANLGGDVPLRGLTVQQADAGVTFGAANVAVPGGSGPVSRVQSVDPIVIGANRSILQGIRFNAGNGQTVRVATTNDLVRLNGPVTLASHLAIDTGNDAGDIEFLNGTVNGEVGEANSLTLTAGTGQIVFTRDVGNQAPLGDLIVTSGRGILFGNADVAAANVGPVSQVRVINTIDLGVGSQALSGTGIVFNAGTAAPLVVSTQAGDLRVNGPVTLESDLTMVSGGSIRFTNDTPIDSAAGETHSLKLDAASGAISFQEDLGARQALDALTIDRARDGVLFGQATTEVPGTGATGPVERIALEGTLNLGTTAAIGGAGIVLTGSTTAPLRLTTSSDLVRFHGAVTLATDVDIATGNGGEVVFTQAASVDSAAGRTSSLRIDAGTAAVRFNEDLGANQRLGALTISRADGGLYFGEADTETTDGSLLGPVQQIHLDQFADFGVGTQVIQGGLHFQGGAGGLELATTGDQVRLNGPVRLQSAVSIDTGAGPGDVVFTGAATVDSHDGPAVGTQLERNGLTIEAGSGSVAFGANLGATQALGALIIESAAGGLWIGSSDTVIAGGGGPVQRVQSDGPIDFGAGSAPTDVLGKIVLQGGAAGLLIETSGDLTRFNGPVTLDSNVTFHTGGGDLIWTTAASGNSATGETPTLRLDVAGGNATFASSLGAANRLGEVVIDQAHDVTFAGPVAAGRIVQTSGSGTTTFSREVTTTNAGQIGLDLHGNHFRFDGGVVATGDGRVLLEHRGILDWNPGAAFRIDGTFREFGGGTVELGGSLATSGDAIRFESPLVLTDGTADRSLISTVAGGNSAGADVSWLGTVNGTLAGVQGLLINAGTGGDVLFGQAVGAQVALGTITVVSADQLRFASTLTAARVQQLAGEGQTAFDAAVVLQHPTLAGLDLVAESIQFGAAVTTTGQGTVRLAPRSRLEILPANWNLAGEFQQLGDALTRLAAQLTTSGDLVSFAGPVQLLADVRVDTGAGPGDIRFLNLVSGEGGNRNLTLSAGTGDVLFANRVGGGIADLRLESAHHADFADAVVSSLSQLTGTGTTTIHGVVSASGASGIDLANGSVIILGQLHTTAAGLGSPIRLSALGDLSVTGTLTGLDGELSLTAGGNIVLEPTASLSTDRGNIRLQGGAVAMAAGATILSGTGNLRVDATGDIVLATLTTQDQILVTSTQGAIRDAGDGVNPNLTAAAARLSAARGIGTDATGSGKNATVADFLETNVAILAATNLSVGGIHIRDVGNGTLRLGTVDGANGVRNGGGGPIEIFHAGAVVVDQPVLATGGGDIDLRSGVGADLTVNRSVQSTFGNGSILLFAGGDLIVHDSLPEPPGRAENPTNPEQYFELMVVGEGAIRGEAGRQVHLDNGTTNYVIAHTATGQATNVAPLLSIQPVDQGGSNVDETGRAYVEVTIGDDVHLETNFHVQIDWGDGEIESFPIPGSIRLDPADPKGPIPASVDARLVSGEADNTGTLQPGVYRFSHRYFVHPNPSDPSKPIPIRVELRYDARPTGNTAIDGNRPASGSAIFNGIRFVDQVAREVVAVQTGQLTVPGTGGVNFVKVVESVIVPVEIRTAVAPPPIETAVSFASSAGLRSDFRIARFESQTQEEYRLFLRLVDDVNQTEGTEDIPVPLKWLDDPLSLFRSRRFPNGHYRVYLEEVRTRRTRLILDVHIFDGRVVPPTFREGAGERPPGANQQTEPPNPDNAAHVQLLTDHLAQADRTDSTPSHSLAGPAWPIHRSARLTRQIRLPDSTP